MKNRNLSILTLLILLTLGSFIFSRYNDEFGVMLFLVTVVKVMLVILFFMEMRKAHFAWIGVLGLVMMVYLIFIFQSMSRIY